MATLLGLPCELLLQVLQFGFPESLEASTLSCSTLHQVASPLLIRHRSYNVQWAHVSIGLSRIKPNFGFRGVHPLSVVNALIKDPTIALYIQRLTWNFEFFCVDPPSEPLARAWSSLLNNCPPFSEMEGELKHLVDFCGVLDCSDLSAQGFVEAVVNPGSSESLLLLILLLPNLRAMQITPIRDDVLSIDILSEVAIAVDKANEQATHPGFLTSLQSLEFIALAEDDDLSEISPWLRLPMLKEIAVHGGIACETGPDRRLRTSTYAAVESQAESVVIRRSLLASKEAAQYFLQPFTRLKRFEYDNLKPSQDLEEPIFDDGRGLLNALLALEEHKPDLLEHLTLTSYDKVRQLGTRRGPNGVVTFKIFKNLKSLEVDSYYLTADSGLHQFVDLLPDCLESLTLYIAPRSKRRIGPLFEGMETGLPNLEDVTLRHVGGDADYPERSGLEAMFRDRRVRFQNRIGRRITPFEESIEVYP